MTSKVKQSGQWLYDVLLRPTEAIWRTNGAEVVVDRLIVVPHGILHTLPFSTLFDGKEFIAERVPVVQSPSASVLRYCYEKRPRSPESFTYFGFANPGADSLPGFENVVLHVAKKFGFESDWEDNRIAGEGFLGVRRQAATHSAFLENAGRYTCVDLETHGQFITDVDRPLSHRFLVMDEDGVSDWLTARELFLSLRMRADLLVAAMCNSGQFKLLAGDELVGLLRGFMFAGCRSLVVYPWLLLDEGAELFLREFYNHLIKLDERGYPCSAISKDRALQAAQIHLIGLGRLGESPSNSDTTWEHPHYWGLVLFGDHL